tara:strand:- start:154 stop:1446 length:1293 start_codon:yes stop_codon:yes gene_type:complete
MTNKKPSKRARVNRPERSQVEMHCFSLEQLLPKDHRARLVWSYVQQLDLEPCYEQIVVSDSQSGRSAIAPEILYSLWLLATLDGIGSAREIERRCKLDIPYMWICGNVSVNHHTISDFRTGHVELLDRNLVDSVASMIYTGIVPLETIAVDGMRVRANAGKSSFRRKPTLSELQAEAQAHLDKLKEEGESESGRHQANARRSAAAERAARERKERIDEALKQHEELAKQREQRTKGEGERTRTSTTDPDARKMKMANGGFDPAFNVQFATDAHSRVIVAVDVTNEGTDGGQLQPIHKKVCDAYDRTPEKVIADSAYATKEGVTAVEAKGTNVISSIPRSEQLQKHGKDPHSPQKGDTPEYVQFRARMADPQNQELYKTRPSIAEFPNADCRNRNLKQFRVRGLAKVKAVALWHALAFNFTRMLNLEVLAT